MAYEKVNWQAGTLLTFARFNQMETQYDEIKAYWITNPFRIENEEIAVEVRSGAPATHIEGRIYYNSTTGNLYFSDGTDLITVEGT